MVHRRHARHQTTAHYETRDSIGPLMKSSDEAEAEAEDIRAVTRIVIVHLGMIEETVEEEMAEVDTAVVVVDIRATGLRTTRMTTVEVY